MPDTPRPVVPLPDRPMLTPAEVATAFGVDPKTVARWAQEGKLHTIRTPSLPGAPGHRRFFRSQIDELLNGPEAGK
jgi:excisionase family DNA binding protein